MSGNTDDYEWERLVKAIKPVFNLLDKQGVKLQTKKSGSGKGKGPYRLVCQDQISRAARVESPKSEAEAEHVIFMSKMGVSLLMRRKRKAPAKNSATCSDDKSYWLNISRSLSLIAEGKEPYAWTPGILKLRDGYEKLPWLGFLNTPRVLTQGENIIDQQTKIEMDRVKFGNNHSICVTEETINHHAEASENFIHALLDAKAVWIEKIKKPGNEIKVLYNRTLKLKDAVLHPWVEYFELYRGIISQSLPLSYRSMIQCLRYIEQLEKEQPGEQGRKLRNFYRRLGLSHQNDAVTCLEMMRLLGRDGFYDTLRHLNGWSTASVVEFWAEFQAMALHLLAFYETPS
ncbi:MAG: hypothetical protein M1834_001173 [Cirrosporium novae-zelandiae]|nr:MAG: hypothetical protein M1834_001173 [Cirrosporium novae-zelandiae]